MKRIEIIGARNKQDSYGFIGEQTGFKNLNVGDVIVYELFDRSLNKGLVVRHYGHYCLMGWCSSPIEELFKDKIKKYCLAVSARHVTEDILNSINSNYFELKEIASIELTQEEIEKRLGYPISIIPYHGGK